MSNQQKLYIAIAGGESMKIGVSVDPESRVRDLQVGHSENIELAHSIGFEDIDSSAKNAEKNLHELLKDEGFHKRGEWFNMDGYYFVSGWIMGVVESEMNLVVN